MEYVIRQYNEDTEGDNTRPLLRQIGQLLGSTASRVRRVQQLQEMVDDFKAVGARVVHTGKEPRTVFKDQDPE